jgi:hypothetical protein
MLNSLIGIIASSGAGGVANSYESIATTTVGAGGSSTITFSSIPSTYQHLQLRTITRNTASATDGTWMRFNSDATSGNYVNHDIYGDGASAGAEALTTSQTGIIDTTLLSNASYTNIFNISVIDILDYANTNKNKTVRTLSGLDVNGAGGQILFRSGLWMSTSAISSITFVARGSGTFAQYSQIALYGIKG